MGLQRARSAPMAGMNGSRNHALGESYAYAEKDTSDIDLNHRLESLCLSMTEVAWTFDPVFREAASAKDVAGVLPQGSRVSQPFDAFHLAVC